MQWLWKLKVTPKLHLFLWLVWWDRLPTKNLLHLRNIVQDNECPCCKDESENTLHVLRDCVRAEKVWDLLSPPVTFWHQGQVGLWIKESVSIDRETQGVSWSILIPFLCYEIWVGRNKFVFEGVQPATPHATLARSVQQAKYFLAASLSTQDLSPIPVPYSVESFINRNHFTVNWVHVNVDASYVDIETESCIAGIIRNNYGRWKLGFCCLSYTANPLHAELIAIRQGLHIASEEGYTHVALHSDCSQAISMILQSERFEEDFYSDLILQCRELLLYFQETSLSFVKRADNRPVDAMTHGARRETTPLNLIRMYPSPPDYCQTLLANDCKRLFNVVI